MTVHDQPRRPPGSEGAGQWSSRSYDEGDISLDDWSKDGSYAYPPQLYTADETASFWGKVELPEVVMRRVDRAYRQARQDEMNSAVRVNNMAGRGTPERGQQAALDALDGRPARISPVAMRSLVRLANMHWYAQEVLPEDERALMEKHRFDVSGIGHASPGEVVRKYGFDEIRDDFDDPGEYVEMQEQIAALRGEMAFGLQSIREVISEE